MTARSNRALYNKDDVVNHYDKAEGLMPAGLPVVSTDCPPGSTEILDGGRFGTLVPCRDPDRLASAMASALDGETDPEVQKARAAHYSTDVAVNNYLGLMVENSKT